ncbi:MAG TPA: transglycosylase domain-containing protein, partial [Acidobacteriaceae bacterium]|nr:transglycosylase domain-containing protein [Acidobacteriaceae bacterium]
MRAQPVRWKIARRHLATRRPHRLRWTLVSLFAVSVLLFGAAGGAAAFYITSHTPSVSKFHIHYAFQDARIYDSQGQLLYTLADLGKNGGRRIVEPLQGRYDHGNACRGDTDRIPLDLQNATIATEDATFYKNPGFDPLSIVRAAYQDATYGHIVSGASTITQQVVRSVVLNDKQTFQRKAEEVALAYEVTKHYSKRKILWFYLNNVNYGNLAYGATAAARVYFHEPVCRLDLAQAAFLAGLPEAPSAYDPVLHHQKALERLNTVLHLLHQHGYIHTWARVRAARAEARRWRFTPTDNTMRFPAFTRYVINQLQNVPQFRRYLYKGIDVYTTVNPRLQTLAQNLVTTQINSLQAEHVTDGALVSLDIRPQHYGWIMAMVGSANQKERGGQINMAVSPRQPGSSMKPFNYIWAFTHGGVGPGTTVVDAPLALPDPGDTLDNGWYAPTDYDHQWHGTVTLREALDNSLNVPAVKVEYYITHVPNVAQTAYTFGMRSLYKDNPGLSCSVCYALTLGGLSNGTRLLEETSAYGVFASGGKTVPPVAIWKIVERSNRKVLYCSADCGKVKAP